MTINISILTHICQYLWINPTLPINWWFCSMADSPNLTLLLTITFSVFTLYHSHLRILLLLLNALQIQREFRFLLVFVELNTLFVADTSSTAFFIRSAFVLVDLRVSLLVTLQSISLSIFLLLITHFLVFTSYQHHIYLLYLFIMLLQQFVLLMNQLIQKLLLLVMVNSILLYFLLLFLELVKNLLFKLLVLIQIHIFVLILVFVQLHLLLFIVSVSLDSFFL